MVSQEDSRLNNQPDIPFGDAQESTPLLTEGGLNSASFPGRATAEGDQEKERNVVAVWFYRTWDAYSGGLERYPLLVKSSTAFLLMGMADLCAQTVEHREHVGPAIALHRFDYPRMLRYALFGLLGTPWSHYYYYFLDAKLPPSDQPFSRTTFVKVFIDQFLQAPVLLAVIIIFLGLLQGDTLPGVWDDLRNRYWGTLVANWKLWLPASVVNIAFVRPELRVLFCNVVFFAWIVILSLMLSG